MSHMRWYRYDKCDLNCFSDMGLGGGFFFCRVLRFPLHLQLANMTVIDMKEIFIVSLINKIITDTLLRIEFRMNENQQYANGEWTRYVVG